MKNSKEDYPLISIVMINNNGLKYLKKTIPSILELDYPNYEIIVVDNGSTDGSIEFIEKIEKIKLIQSPRLREKNFACNYAVNHAKGEYLFLLDNDALLVNNKILFELIEQYKFNDKTGVLGLAYINKNESKSASYGCYLGYNLNKPVPTIESAKIKKMNNSYIGYPCGLAMFIKKSVWNYVKGYEDFLKFGGDDSDLGIKLWLMGYKNYLYSKTIQIHIGLSERKNNYKYALKFKETSYANMFTIVKNYKFPNMLITLIIHTNFNFLKSIKQSLFRRDMRPFLSFFSGYYLFIKNLPVALEKRKEMQSKRIIKDDIFLKIRPPEVD